MQGRQTGALPQWPTPPNFYPCVVGHANDCNKISGIRWAGRKLL